MQTVFRAISDPTRRAIIGMLADQAMSVGQVANHFDMTRPAVAKHLKVLSEGGLIKVENRGRERINRLNPAPLKSIAEWVSDFDHFWDERLQELKAEVEKDT
tara:strand:+ start:936 stop:1241 length:306 start_codon:yes stop_codon:yes gene_type:complete